MLDAEALATCGAASLAKHLPAPRSASELPKVSAKTGCVADSSHACSAQDRFRVSLDWSTGATAPTAASVEAITADTAYSWFFDPDNVEVVVKVLDACSQFDQFWVFTSGLTEVGTLLELTDTTTGAVWRRE